MATVLLSFTALYALGAANQVFSAEVIAPVEAADAEGSRSVLAGGAARVQFRYSAVDFELAPRGQRTITAMAFRPDARNTNTFPLVGPLTVRLSTIASDDQLEMHYSENLGEDGVVVFDGMMRWQTSDSSEQPRDFDFQIPFQNPFDFDPLMGDLLVDFLAPAGWSSVNDWSIDSWPSDIFSTIAGPPHEPRATVRPGEIWPAQFTVVPQPWMGDANLDGVFNSSDLVHIFGVGEYEDAVENNSTWADGDWDGDGDFTSSDLVAAFVDGGYEQGLRPTAVPEPSSMFLLTLGIATATAWMTSSEAVYW